MNSTNAFEPSIEFHFDDYDTYPFPEDKFREWIFFIIKNEDQIPGDINFIFCSDDYLHKMNMEYLQHDTLTDIITFDYTADFDNISGDIFISLDRVAENAKIFGVSFDQEFSRIIAHGILHLIGFKDKLPSDKSVMKAKEEEYLNALS